MAAALDHAGHRLAHAAADVADDAAALDLATGLAQRRAERIAERQVAQVANVQGLGRVGVPEVEREAATGGEVGVRRRLAGGEGSAGRLDPLRGEARLYLSAVAVDALDPGLALDPLQRRDRVGVLLPALHPRHQHQVEVVLRLIRGSRRPEGTLLLAAS